jgi:hypothetical protein
VYCGKLYVVTVKKNSELNEKKIEEKLKKMKKPKKMKKKNEKKKHK